MKRSVITGLFLLISVLGFPQGENNIWYFGKRAGLDFNSGNPVTLTNCSSVGDNYSFSETDTVSFKQGECVFDQVSKRIENRMKYVENLCNFKV